VNKGTFLNKLKMRPVMTEPKWRKNRLSILQDTKAANTFYNGSLSEGEGERVQKYGDNAGKSEQ
jgi:hypothetical protein